MISEPGDDPKGVLAEEAEGSETSANHYPGPVALSMLNRLGWGCLVVQDQRKIIEANATARLVLGRGTDAVQNLDQMMSALKRLILRAPNRPKLGPLTWVIMWNREDAPFIVNQAAEGVPPGVSVVILVDLETELQPNPAMLQGMFGLTLAETRLALELARGDPPTDVARSRNLSRSTIRSQLASVFSKTSTRRQAELVKLLALLALLP